MTFHYFSKNGTILPIDQATIPLSNIEYSYGFGVYETLKVRDGVIYFVDQHLKRLQQSTEIIGLEHPFSMQDMKQYLIDLVENNGNVQACNIKMLLIGASKKEDAQLFIMVLAPLFPNRKLYSHGAKTIAVNYQRIYPNAKTLNMLGSYMAYKKAQEQGCYDALLIDEENNILEGTRTNIFALQGKTLITPPKEKVLEGVTRETVMYVARKQGFIIEEQDIPLKNIQTYDGLFITSTSTKIIPLKQLNDTILQIPETVKLLMKAYDEFLETSQGIF